MKLIVGGSYKGKTEYLLSQLALSPEQIVAGEKLAAEHSVEDAGNNGIKSAKWMAINHLHLYIRERLLQGADRETILEEILSWLEQSPELILVCDEVGCGIVPMEAFEREYRESVGRICCVLAQRAEQVIRVCCGLGTVIRQQ